MTSITRKCDTWYELLMGLQRMVTKSVLETRRDHLALWRVSRTDAVLAKHIVGRSEVLMLAKCANPSCSQSFHRLGHGRLFRLEPDSASNGGAAEPGDGDSRVEYFWLCRDCLKSMTLRLDKSGSVSVEPLALADPDNYPEVAIVCRQRGMLLRSVGTAKQPHRA